MRRSTHLLTTQDKLLCELPCLLNPIPAILEWSACFFSLSLISLYGGWSRIIPGKPQQGQTNIDPWPIYLIPTSSIFPFRLELPLPFDNFICVLSLPVSYYPLIFSVQSFLMVDSDRPGDSSVGLYIYFSTYIYLEVWWIVSGGYRKFYLLLFLNLHAGCLKRFNLRQLSSKEIFPKAVWSKEW